MTDATGTADERTVRVLVSFGVRAVVARELAKRDDVIQAGHAAVSTLAQSVRREHWCRDHAALLVHRIRGGALAAGADGADEITPDELLRHAKRELAIYRQDRLPHSPAEFCSRENFEFWLKHRGQQMLADRLADPEFRARAIEAKRRDAERAAAEKAGWIEANRAAEVRGRQQIEAMHAASSSAAPVVKKTRDDRTRPAAAAPPPPPPPPDLDLWKSRIRAWRDGVVTRSTTTAENGGAS
jgi:hypothetical protein